MKTVVKLFTSSLGRKFIMAVSGVVLVLFAVGHMIGNLQIFLPPEAINRYAHFLQTNLELLWPVRISLLAMACLHIWAAIRLSLENKRARPVPYEVGKPNDASLASRTMLVGGFIIAAFIVYHLLHYTVRLESVNGMKLDFRSLKTPEGHPDVYAMMIAGFSPQVWYVSLFYIIAVGMLCVHLSHGLQAMFQSLGFRNHYYSPMVKKAAIAISVLLFLGYASIPAAVMLGHGREHLKQAKTSALATLTAGEEAVK